MRERNSDSGRHRLWHPEDFKRPIWEYIENTFTPSPEAARKRVLAMLLHARDEVTKPVLVCFAAGGANDPLTDNIAWWIDRFIVLTEAVDRLKGER